VPVDGPAVSPRRDGESAVSPEQVAGRTWAEESMDKRSSQRFDKVFPVWVESAALGECQAIARNISGGGIFGEIAGPPPRSSQGRVHFTAPDAQGWLVARGEVKRHYFLHFSDADGPRTLTGMGVRFTGFEQDGYEQLGTSLARYRTLH